MTTAHTPDIFDLLGGVVPTGSSPTRARAIQAVRQERAAAATRSFDGNCILDESDSAFWEEVDAREAEFDSPSGGLPSLAVEDKGTYDAYWATVPSRYQGRRIDEASSAPLLGEDRGWAGSLDAEGMLKMAQYIENPCQFLLLRGAGGVGKSTLAATVAGDIVARTGVPAVFIPEADLTDELRSRTALDKYAKVPLLVIDDLARFSKTTSTGFARLIERRWASERLTILTTPRAVKPSSRAEKGDVSLTEWLGDFCWDRVCSDLTRVTMHGESLR